MVGGVLFVLMSAVFCYTVVPNLVSQWSAENKDFE